MTRRFIVGLIALLLAGQVVRTAAVEAFASARPDVAERVWAGHPTVELSAALISIANAAREGRRVSPPIFEKVADAAKKAPLAPEPYLVRGVQAQLSGNQSAAEQAFLAARWRDGRSLPARYFLANQYLSRGDGRRGLPEIAALARLAPSGVGSLAPYVAVYARDRSNWPQLRKLFGSDRSLEDATLLALSKDPSNADLVMSLSDPRRRGRDSPWLSGLLGNLVASGQYAKARQIWTTVTGVRVDPGTLVYDPQFTRSDAPPPFNWTLTSSTVGLAERRAGGGLHVIFYGQEDGVLASQTVILPPGRYRMSSKPSGVATRLEALEWRLVCGRTGNPIASIPLNASFANVWHFEVPADCLGQRLELFGSSSDIPQQSEATVGSVILMREGSA